MFESTMGHLESVPNYIAANSQNLKYVINKLFLDLILNQEEKRDLCVEQQPPNRFLLDEIGYIY